MDVVVGVLLLELANMGSRSLSLADNLSVFVCGPHLLELGLVLRVHLLLVLLDLNGGNGVDVLGGKNLVVLNRLDSVLQSSACGWRGAAGRDIPGGGERASLGR